MMIDFSSISRPIFRLLSERLTQKEANLLPKRDYSTGNLKTIATITK
jgi:hypothetical protein